jgi:hypothetical protein
MSGVMRTLSLVLYKKNCKIAFDRNLDSKS